MSLAYRFFPLTDGLSTLAVVLIIVGCILLLVIVTGLVICMCLSMRAGHQRKLAHVGWEGRTNYADRRRRGDNFVEDEMRMDRLWQVMRHSPYLQQVRS